MSACCCDGLRQSIHTSSICVSDLSHISSHHSPLLLLCTSIALVYHSHRSIVLAYTLSHPHRYDCNRLSIRRSWPSSSRSTSHQLRRLHSQPHHTTSSTARLPATCSRRSNTLPQHYTPHTRHTTHHPTTQTHPPAHHTLPTARPVTGAAGGSDGRVPAAVFDVGSVG